MNLTKYFFENYNPNEFPHYSKRLETINIHEYEDYPCDYIDDEKIISAWKNMTYPSNRGHIEIDEVHFLFISFYLNKEGYIIKEHPNLLQKIDSLYNVSEVTLKNATRNEFGTDYREAVTWAARRKYSDSLTFEKCDKTIPYSQNIADIIKMVSPRNADFSQMPIDEKLGEIRNAFSNLGKLENGKYMNIDFGIITSGIFSNDDVLKFQNILQCFRHGEKEMLDKRQQYSVEQKQFMIDLGLSLLNATERHINTNKKDS